VRVKKGLLIVGVLAGCAVGEGPGDVPIDGAADKARVVVVENGSDDRSVGALWMQCDEGEWYRAVSATLIGLRTALTIADPMLELSDWNCEYAYEPADGGFIPVTTIVPSDGLAVAYLLDDALGSQTKKIDDATAVPGRRMKVFLDASVRPAERLVRPTDVTLLGGGDFHTTACGRAGDPVIWNGERADQGLAGIYATPAPGESCTTRAIRVDTRRAWIASAAGDDFGCAGVDYAGYCSGASGSDAHVVWCDFGVLRTFDCAATHGLGAGCGYVDDEVGHWCTK
jgi:hypothetical protein